MIRFPLIPSILVAAAVATMIALGFWQLRRADEKKDLQRHYERNFALPPMALPPGALADETLLYRRATAFCLEVTEWRTTGGKAASGRGGTRFIANCRTGAEGPGFAAEMGISLDPKARPAWKGGEVAGRIVAEPRSGGLFERLAATSPPPRPMIVSERPAQGLESSAPPAAEAPNNSFAYAFQWFFFAAAAAAIYLLALRKRKSPTPGPPPSSP
ncbi:MAG TPA: SURF1 family cytochrome oxidase biogenesis protein [Allosphingosinicella sp.]|nr:SURF1 family cytochrome oxidase biogenesis protein [Allosphingosinicella sp.]